MNADILDSLTARVLGAAFFEKAYQRALLKELGFRGIPATTEASIPVVYKGYSVE
jgi:hypothetical protein